MILSCPSCATRYVLDPARLRPSGRTVRCARCGHTWHEEAPPVSADEVVPEPAPPPPAPETTPGPAAAPEPPVRPRRASQKADPAERRNLPALPRERGLGTALGWAGLVLFVAIVVGGVLLFPDPITRAWPPARQLYSVLGLEDRLSGSTPAQARPPIEERLRFSELAPSQRFIDGVLTLVISGRIENIGDSAEVLPPVEVVLLDSRRLDLKTWIFEPPTRVLAPGQSVNFETRLENPPPEAQDISLSFAVPGAAP